MYSVVLCCCCFDIALRVSAPQRLDAVVHSKTKHFAVQLTFLPPSRMNHRKDNKTPKTKNGNLLKWRLLLI